MKLTLTALSGWLNRLITPTVQAAAGPGATRRARRTAAVAVALMSIFLPLLIATFVLIPLNPEFPDEAIPFVATVVTTAIGVLVLALWLCHRGSVDLSAFLITTVIFVLSLAGAWQIRRIASLPYVVVGAAVAGLLLPRRLVLIELVFAATGVTLVGLGMGLGAEPGGLVSLTDTFVLLAAVGAVSSSTAVAHERDITQLGEQADRIALDQERLLALRQNEWMGRLAAGLANEFNNAATSAVAVSTLIQQKTTGQVQGWAESVHESVVRVANIADQLLAFARQQFMRMTSIDLTALLSDLVRELGADQASNLVLNVTVPAAWVRFDERHLHTCLVPLVKRCQANASEVVTVTVASGTLEQAAEEPVSATEIIINDDGPTPSEETVARLFDPYFTTGEFGTGSLELAAAQGIVRQGGGELLHVRTEGHGYRFQLTLPAAPPGPAPAAIPGAATSRTAS